MMTMKMPLVTTMVMMITVMTYDYGDDMLSFVRISGKLSHNLIGWRIPVT